MINDTTAQVLGPDGETMVTVDLADPPEWIDLAALRADAAAHGDTDLVATIDDLHPGAVSLVDEVAEQLAEELGERAHSLAKLVGPDAAMEWPSVMGLVAPALAAQLVQDEDDRLAAQTVIDVMCALWPNGSPETVGRADWWRTPLGRVCARSLGRDDAEAVTHSVAAAMLGVPRGSIGPMIHRGHLDRHPDGGVLRASVLQRLADRH